MRKEELQMQRQTMPMESLVQLLLLQMDNGGRARLTVTGYSMMPMLRNGTDAVELIKAVEKRKKGDIILYRRENGSYVLHRIIGLSDGGYVCCGDNQAMREPVSAQQVIAVVDGFYRNGKHYALNHAGYRLYTAICVGLVPLRGVYIAIRRPLGKLFRTIRPKNGG